MNKYKVIFMARPIGTDCQASFQSFLMTAIDKNEVRAKLHLVYEEIAGLVIEEI